MLDLLPWEEPTQRLPRYLKPVMLAAGFFHLVCGLAVLVISFSGWQSAVDAAPSILWRCVGMLVAAFGVGYLVAARNPLRHWPLVLVGLIEKVCGPLLLLLPGNVEGLPWWWGWGVFVYSVVWWIPFTAILIDALKLHSNTGFGHPIDIDDAMSLFHSQQDSSLENLSEQPLMLVFLRHFGCVFCRETLADLATSRQEIEKAGLNLAVVHMSNQSQADQMLAKVGLKEINHFSDETCEIYQAFGLERGTVWQLLGPRVWWRGLLATFSGHWVGALAGDGFRMPGIFFIHRGEVCGVYRHRTAADRPDYADLAQRFRESLDSPAFADGA